MPSEMVTSRPFPLANFSRTADRNASLSKSVSGRYTRCSQGMRSAYSAEAAVIHPALRPISSITTTWMGRADASWAASRAEAAANLAALPKPGQWSVTARSLSMVLGIPITRSS